MRRLEAWPAAFRGHPRVRERSARHVLPPSRVGTEQHLGQSGRKPRSTRSRQASSTIGRIPARVRGFPYSARPLPRVDAVVLISATGTADSSWESDDSLHACPQPFRSRDSLRSRVGERHPSDSPVFPWRVDVAHCEARDGAATPTGHWTIPNLLRTSLHARRDGANERGRAHRARPRPRRKTDRPQAAPRFKEVTPKAKIIFFTARAELREVAARVPAVDPFVLKTESSRLLRIAQELLDMAGSAT